MKLLFSPAGLIIILILVTIIFLPRRLPDSAKKLRKPMRAFPDEPKSPSDSRSDSGNDSGSKSSDAQDKP